jgi:hypothetical protein
MAPWVKYPFWRTHGSAALYRQYQADVWLYTTTQPLPVSTTLADQRTRQAKKTGVTVSPCHKVKHSLALHRVTIGALIAPLLLLKVLVGPLRTQCTSNARSC